MPRQRQQQPNQRQQLRWSQSQMGSPEAAPLVQVPEQLVLTVFLKLTCLRHVPTANPTCPSSVCIRESCLPLCCACSVLFFPLCEHCQHCTLSVSFQHCPALTPVCIAPILPAPISGLPIARCCCFLNAGCPATRAPPPATSCRQNPSRTAARCVPPAAALPAPQPVTPGTCIWQGSGRLGDGKQKEV